jgi:hypothetical protein
MKGLEKEKKHKDFKEKFSVQKNITEAWKSIPENLKTPLLFFIVILLLMFFYYPVTFGDKTIQSMDVLLNKALREYTSKDKEGFTLWNPHLFCGMPAYATAIAQRGFDLTILIYSLSSRVYSIFLKDYNAIYTFSFLIMSITSFWFMRSRGAGRGVSFLTSIGMIFSSGIVVLFFSGHTTKLVSLSLIPFLLMLILRFQKEIKIIDVLLFILGLHLFINVTQVQIVFYAMLTFVVYVVFYAAYGLVKKDKLIIKQLGKTVGIICAASIIALLMSYDIYSQLYEYKPYSTRTTESLNKNTNTVVDPTKSELYKYNTNWSFSPEELMTFIIPSYYGYGGFQYKGDLTKGEEIEINTYFGQMELVNMPMYMGIVILFLGLFALFARWKEPFIKFCGVTIVFFLLISFGRNFPIVYNLMYKYFPVFNSFRVPSMILHIIQIFFPILAGLGVMKIIEMNDAKKNLLAKRIKYFFFISVVLLIIAANQSNLLGNWFYERMQNAAVDDSEKSKMLLHFSVYATNIFLSDVNFALILFAAVSLVIWLFVIKKINKIIFVGLLTILILFDLIRIDLRGSIYINRQDIQNLYVNDKAVTAIKKQKDKEPFRIADIRQNGLGTINQNNGYYTYYLLEDISGYSAAKPKTYDDIIKEVGLGNLVFWRMANVKYTISDFPIRDANYEEIYASDGTYVYKCLKALSRAYFVDSVAVKSPNEIFDALKRGLFDPQKVAFADKLDFRFDKPDSSAYSKITNYNDEKLELDVNASGNNFLVFSTNYMPVGWKAYIDNNEVPIVKTNHTFMGTIIPQGKHKVRFVYAPVNFFIGKYISLILNILLIGGLILVLIKKKKEQNNPKTDEQFLVKEP